MKEMLTMYIKLTRSGLLNMTNFVIVGTVLGMFLFGIHLGTVLEVLVFILTLLGMLLDFDAKKYVINYSLPMRIKKRLKLLYYITGIDCLLAVSAVHIRFYLIGTPRSIWASLTVFFIDMIGCSIYYALFCSQEFKKDILDEDKKQFVYQFLIGILIGVCISLKLRVGTISNITQYWARLSDNIKIVGTVLMGVMACLAIYYSMNKLEKVVCNAGTADNTGSQFK